MLLLKSIVAGIVVAIVAIVLSAIVVVIGTFGWLQFQMWRQTSEGSGGIGAVSAGIGESFVVVALILGVLGFVAGFRWQIRRASR